MQFIVTLDIPETATPRETQDYILDAVCGWKGGLDPEDPLSQLNRETVKVTRVYLRTPTKPLEIEATSAIKTLFHAFCIPCDRIVQQWWADGKYLYCGVCRGQLDLLEEAMISPAISGEAPRESV